ncbi:MAG: FAD-dependent oxidoreductase [Candidatus Scatomorpha sp.]|jgi:2-enoate reductase
MDYSKLLQPLKTRCFTLKNRMIFSPVAGYMATHNGYCDASTIAWVRDIASGGAAAVSIGTGIINEVPPFVVGCTRLWDDSCIQGLNQTFTAIHMFDAKAGVELVPMHPDPDPFDVRDKKGKKQVEIDPNAYTIEEVRTMIRQYADAAERVLKAEGDYVVVHGAHLQPPAAFFSKLYNERHDEYGCDSFENRCRFAVEVLAGIRQRVGSKLAIEYRISGDDMMEGSPDMEELVAFAKVIEPYIDWLHVSRGQLSVHKLTPYVFPPLYFKRGFNLGYAEQFKRALSIPVSCVGGMNAQYGAEAINAGRIDLVSMGRPLLADPQIPNKIRHGHPEDIKPCIRCNNCIHRTHNCFLPVRCAVNPVQGRDIMIDTYPQPRGSRKVAVIGGGASGMEAARIAAERGHKVTLYEKEDHLGGVLNIAAASPMKNDLKLYLEWSIAQLLKNPDIDVRLGCDISPEALKAEGCDAIILAVGADPLIPGFLAGSEKVVWVGDVELGRVQTGQNVVIVGAGMTGMECGADLARAGKNVKLIDMLPADEIGQGGSKMNILAIKEILAKNNAPILDSTRLDGVTDKGISVTGPEGSYELECDTVILSLGVRPRYDLVESFRGCAPDVVAVGNCNTVAGTVMTATQMGFDAAYSIM